MKPGNQPNQQWSIRQIGTGSVGVPTDVAKWLKRPIPGPTAVTALFEITNRNNTAERAYFAYSGGGIGMGTPFFQASASVPLGSVNFDTDTPIRMSDFGGAAQYHKVSLGVGLGYTFVSQIVFNTKVSIQGRGFWDTLLDGSQGVNLPGPSAGTGADVSSTLGILSRILSSDERELDRLDTEIPRVREALRQEQVARGRAETDALEAARQATSELSQHERFTEETGDYRSTPPPPSTGERIDTLERARQAAREMSESSRFTEDTGRYQSIPPAPQPSVKLDALEQAKQGARELCEPEQFTEQTGSYQSRPTTQPSARPDALEEAKRSARELCEPEQFTEQTGAPQSRPTTAPAGIPQQACPFGKPV